MAVNGLQPFVKVLDSNGVPIVAAVLKVYAVGTTTPLSIFSDAALTIPLSNPLTGVNASNASGDFPRFYMAAGLYKLRAETSTGTLIWEWDNIDSGTPTGGTLPISSGGTGSITAPAALTALGAAASSDVTALAAQITAFTAALQNLISVPQGRLTLTTGTPVLATGITGATSVFYTPFTGTIVPIYNGVNFIPTTFAELTLTLSSSHLLNSIYDCFIINDSGTVRIVTGPVWSTLAGGAGARGTGAGTSELVLQNGLWVNKNAMATARNGATTYNVVALGGTYVGSLFIDATAGQISCHTAYGQSRKWGVWNAYNRQRINLLTGDGTASWTPSGSFISVNSNAANSATVFTGLPIEPVTSIYQQNSTVSYSNNTASGEIGIGQNITSASAGTIGSLIGGNTSTSGSVGGNMSSTFVLGPTIGINVLLMIELRANTCSNTGTIANCLMTSSWLG